MSKRLEDFIKMNNEEFDDLEPGNDLWNKIESKLPATEIVLPKREAKTFTLGFVMRVAALIVVVMAIGFVLFEKNRTAGGGSSTTGSQMAEINPKLAKEQVHYTSLIESKRVELKALSKSDPQLYKEFSAELAKMDSTYKKLNKDLATSPDQERVLRAMIRNLQIQTDVLNQQLQAIEQFNQVKKDESHDIKNI